MREMSMFEKIMYHSKRIEALERKLDTGKDWREKERYINQQNLRGVLELLSKCESSSVMTEEENDLFLEIESLLLPMMSLVERR